jgi:hypothetical protein
MASIALSVIGCIDYLAYGTIFTRVMFLPKKKGDIFLDFFSRQKSPRCSPGGGVTYEPPKVSVFFVLVTGLVTQLASPVNDPLLAFLLRISMHLSRILVV